MDDERLEEKCLFEIRSGMYDEPIKSPGTVTKEGARIVYSWPKSIMKMKKRHFLL